MKILTVCELNIVQFFQSSIQCESSVHRFICVVSYSKSNRLAGAWTADQKTNWNVENYLSFVRHRILNTFFKKPLSRLINWRHPRGYGVVIDYILSGRNTVWRDIRASCRGSTGHHSDYAKLIGVILLTPQRTKQEAVDGLYFFRKRLERKSPGLRSKISTRLKSAQSHKLLRSDNRLSHSDSFDIFRDLLS